jgi:hypothetical protein
VVIGPTERGAGAAVQPDLATPNAVGAAKAPPRPVPVTAERVVEETTARHGPAGVNAYTLSAVYEQLMDPGLRRHNGFYWTPEEVAGFMCRVALEQGVNMVEPGEPSEIFRICAFDPCCGCGPFLVEGARVLARIYAQRLIRAEPTPELVQEVLPRVVLRCIFGQDIDPIGVELARVAVCIETGGRLPPSVLEQNISQGNTLAGDLPPALEKRWGPHPWKAAAATGDAANSLTTLLGAPDASAGAER